MLRADECFGLEGAAVEYNTSACGFQEVRRLGLFAYI